MFQQPPSNANFAYAPPQIATSAPVQGQATTVVEPAEATTTSTTTTSAPQVGIPAGGTVMAGAPNAAVIPNMNATSMPTTMNAPTTAAPAFQQQYVAAAPVMPGVGYSGGTSGVPTVAPVTAGGYGGGGYTNMGGYGGGLGGGLGGGFGGYNTTMVRAPQTQSQPSVVVVETGRRRHRSHSHSHSHGRHHHHRSHSRGRHGLRRELRHAAEDVVDGVQLGHGHGGYGYGYGQDGGVLPLGRQGHPGLTRTRSYESYRR